MIKQIGWALPGTNPVLTGILMPAGMEGSELTLEGYRLRISARLMTLADRAQAGTARTQMVRIVAPLGWHAIEAACRVRLGDTLDLLEARPDLMDEMLDVSTDSTWPKIVHHDQEAYDYVTSANLGDWVEAMIRCAEADHWRQVGEGVTRVQARA